MPRLTLSAAFSRNSMTEALHAGRVLPEGVSWTVSEIHPSEMFWRQLRFGDFDVSEMSLSSLAIAVSKGQSDWVGLPIFTTRGFCHTGIVVRAAAGIEAPHDLLGRSIGVPEYQQTSAVWSRGALQHEFGVHPEHLKWYMERQPGVSHGGATAFAAPEGVDLQYLAPGSTIGDMLVAGELDAALLYIAAENLVDHSRQAAAQLPGVRPLFADPEREGLRYLEVTGLLPASHCVVIRKSIALEHPWLVLNIYSALVRSKDEARRTMLATMEPYRSTGIMGTPTYRRMSVEDPLPYGLRGQEKVFDTLMTYLLEQGLVARTVALDELFARRTLDL